MDIVKMLAVIDALCSRAFPQGHGGTDAGLGIPGHHLAGPGYFIVELGASAWPRAGDRSERQQTAEDLYALERAVAHQLNVRWGEQLPWGTVTLQERVVRGEDIPEPWATLGVLADELRSWKASGTGRWVVVAVADRETTDDVRLLAIVTDTDPP
ncbi:hypothetical protein ABZV31_22035 [Streptomyces sp. NPDC005202]|uniref:hypothetical protein n=1 Tax=Streptomyces sp. NPDC005202 TaxID=3157021 RepID=UPI0033B6DDCA